MEKQQISDLYTRYGHMIYGRCINILHDEEEARDALQTVFSKLLTQYETILDKQKVVPWIFTCATNHCFNVLRKHKKFNRQIDPDTVHTGEDYDKQIFNNLLLRQLLAGQDKKTRLAVYYTHIEKLDQEEIRALTGMAPASVRRYLRRFEESCRKRIQLSEAT